MRAELKMLHLQLTRKCNLHCRFCGQDHAPVKELDLPDWLGILEQLREYAPGTTLFLWGGEPLLSPFFREVTEAAVRMGFPLEIVTNGTMIDRHADLLREHFQRIYVSVDGPETVHDSIRGKGVFAGVKANLELLRDGRAERIMMSVLAPENLHCFGDLPFGLPVDRVILHEMIYLTEAECAGKDEAFARKWRLNAAPGYRQALAETVAGLQKRNFPLPVEFQPHFPGGQCREPFRHLHIGSDGETSFCTDFTHYTLGNVRQMTLKEIFEGTAAEQFRVHGNQPFCSHCSWKNTPETVVRIN